MNYNHEDAVTIRTNGRKNDASALCELRDVLEGKALIYDACTETPHHSLNPCEGIKSDRVNMIILKHKIAKEIENNA